MPYQGTGVIREVAAGSDGPEASARLGRAAGLRELLFDGIISLAHETSLEVTSYPVESGSDLFDHTYEPPNSLRLVGGVSLLADASPLAAWLSIQTLRVSRKIINITTNIGTYTNMILTKATTIEDRQTQGALLVNLEFKELKIAGVSGVAGGIAVLPTGPAQNRYSAIINRGFVEAQSR